MLAELAVFTAAAKTVAKAIQTGRELSSVATSIGKMAESKDALQTRLSKKKNRTLSSTESEFAGIGSIFALTIGAIGALIYFVKGF